MSKTIEADPNPHEEEQRRAAQERQDQAFLDHAAIAVFAESAGQAHRADDAELARMAERAWDAAVILLKNRRRA